MDQPEVTVFVPDETRALGCRMVPGELDAGTDHQRLDALEAVMLDSGLPVVKMPLEHDFFPGLYRRTITMPAGTLLTSKIHNTEHPYVVLSGRVRVALPGEPAVEFTAGHQGTTRPGTRRLLYIIETCRWATFHPLSPEEEAARQRGAGLEEMLTMIEARIIEPHRHADGTDAHAEYLAGLQALAALPGTDETEGIP